MSSDDLAALQLQLASGTLVTVLINTAMTGFTQEVVVCGPEGHLVAQGGDLRGRRGRDGREEVLHIDVEDLNVNVPESFPTFLPRSPTPAVRKHSSSYLNSRDLTFKEYFG